MDANRICTQLLIPLALPWTYPEQVLDVTAPLDLDDLPMLVRGDLGDHEISRTTVEATDDPGVLRMSCYDIDDSHFHGLNLVVQSAYHGPNVTQELSLLYHETVVRRKRKMDDLLSSGDATPLYLAALFPRSLQVGHRLRGPEAVALARSYGSYNCRGLPPIATNAKGIFQARLWVGRNRLAWTEKEMNSKANRGVYRSMLTKKRSGVGRLKRPLAVRVSVILNGRLVASTSADIKKSVEKVLLNLADPNAEHQSSLYNPATLDECLRAIERAPPVGARPAFIPNFMQCCLNSDALFQNTARDIEEARRGEGWNAVRRLRQSIRFSLQSDSHFVGDKVPDTAQAVVFQPPHLDCFGTVDGLIHVGCTRTGSFTSSSVEDGGEISLAQMQEFAISYGRCFACWGPCSETSSSGSTIRCSVCAIVLHCECANVSEHDKSKWVCSACDDNVPPHNRNGGAMGKCQHCPLPLGLLKPVGSDVMHHVCATWKDAAVVSNKKKDGEVCCLCSAGSGSVVECVAEGCRVLFHPSCATLASAFGNLDNPSGSQDDDVYLCSQYTLAMVDVSTALGGGAGAVCGESTKLPVAFCGYHNPCRNDMFHGLYPEGCYLDPDSEISPALRIPPKRSTTVVVAASNVDGDDEDDDVIDNAATEIEETESED